MKSQDSCEEDGDSGDAGRGAVGEVGTTGMGHDIVLDFS